MANRTVRVILEAVTGTYEKGMQRAAGATEQVAKAGDGARKSWSAFTKNIKENEQAANQLSKTFAVVGAAASSLAVLAVKSFADFDEAMSGAAAASGETAENMALLRDEAIRLGADTVFSATEAAQGIENLARAGVSTADTLGGGLAGSLDLAAAGQLAVADAAELASIAMTQFKLSGEDVPHVADLLAAGAGKALGEVSDLGQALKQSGLVASQFGLSIEETVGGLSAFASAGLLGSDAGTSFRSMLLHLANPMGKTARQMEELGIHAYDARGQFIGLEGLAGVLQDRLGHLTDAQRQQALAQIFGTDAIRAASILYDEGADGIAEWTDAVNDSGYAAEQAAKLQDNLKGDLEQLGGAVETLMIQTGEAADGPLRAIVQGLDSFISKLSETPGAAASILAVVGGVGGLALAAAGLMQGAIFVNNFRTALEALSTSGRALRALDGTLAGVARTAGILGRALPVLGGFLLAGEAARRFNEAAKPIPATLDEVTAAIRRSEDDIRAWDELVSSTDSGKRFLGLFDVADPLAGLDSLEEGLQRLAKNPLSERSPFHPDMYEDVVAIEDQILKADQAIQGMAPEQATERLGELVRMMSDANVSAEEIGRLLPESAKAAEQALKDLQAEGYHVGTSIGEVVSLMAGRLPQGLVVTEQGVMSVSKALAEGITYTDQFGATISATTIELAETADLADLAAEAYGGWTVEQRMLRAAAEEAAAEIRATGGDIEDIDAAVQEAAESYAQWIGEIAAGSQAFIDVGGTIADFTEDAKFNFGGYLTELEEQVRAQEDWERNMIVLAGSASAGLLEHLASLGPEGAQLVQALVDGTDEQLQRMEAIYGSRGIEATGAWADTLVNAAPVWAALMETAGEGAVEAAKREFLEGKTTIQGIIDRYDLEVELNANIDPAISAVNAAISRINNMSATVRVNAYHAAGLNAPVATGGYIRDVADAYGLAGGGMVHRKTYPMGGLVYGPGTPTSDDVPTMLSRREFVQRAAAVDKAGIDAMYRLNSGAFDRDALRSALGLAGGGMVERPHYTVSPYVPSASTPAAASGVADQAAAFQLANRALSSLRGMRVVLDTGQVVGVVDAQIDGRAMWES